MYSNSFACVRLVIGINSGVRQQCVMFHCVHGWGNKRSEMRMEKMEVIFSKEGREWKLAKLLDAGDLILCDESEEDLRGSLGRFIKV